MPKPYSHRYSVTTCPACDNPLTVDGGVLIEIVVLNVNTTVASRLDDDGTVVDVDDMIADGLHADTLCAACDQPLNEYEVF